MSKLLEFVPNFSEGRDAAVVDAIVAAMAATPQVKVLARLDGEPVLVRQDRILAATFHPELTTDRQLQRMFIDMMSRASRINGKQAEDRATGETVTVPLDQERRITC